MVELTSNFDKFGNNLEMLIKERSLVKEVNHWKNHTLNVEYLKGKIRENEFLFRKK